jgi:hypothetical protein
MRADGFRFSPIGALRTTAEDGLILSPTREALRVPSYQRYVGTRCFPQAKVPNFLSYCGIPCWSSAGEGSDPLANNPDARASVTPSQ